MAVVTILTEGLPPRTLALREAVSSLGRSVDNTFEVPDPNMSRRHCVIERRGDHDFIVTDCNSSNGTRVNGERVVARELRDGDRIEVGSTIIVFSLNDEEAEAVPSGDPSSSSRGGLGPLEDSGSKNAPRPSIGRAPPAREQLTTARLTRPANAPPDATRGPAGPIPLSAKEPTAPAGQREIGSGPLRLDPQMAAATLKNERDDLRKLLEINKRLNQEHDLRKLLETIIDAAIELMSAERGFLILVHEGEMRVEIARNMSREALDPRSNGAQVSTQICREVIETGRTVLTTNAAADARYGRYSSVVGLNLRSILCVPFKIKDSVLGTVYLDNANVGAFSKTDADLLAAFSDQAAVAIENARLLRQVKKKERMEQELKIASEIQKKLLPRRIPRIAGLDLYGWMHPAKQVGGDYYDFIPVPGGLLIAIGDVSGKGVPAGLVMASARTALRSLAQRVESTREITIELNRLLTEDLDREMFISLLLMRYEAETGRVLWTGAGHEHLIIYDAEADSIRSIQAGGIVLGLTERIEEHVKEQEFTLGVGDAIVLYTDGVTETIDDKNEQYQLERLEKAFEQHRLSTPREMLHGILADVLKYKGKAQQRDDITLVTIRRTPADEPVPDDPPTVRRRLLPDADEHTDFGKA